MADDFKAPFGTYTSVQIIIAPAQAEQMANIDILIGYLTPVEGTAMAHPDFCKIPPATAALIVAELNGIKAAIDAAPVA